MAQAPQYNPTTDFSDDERNNVGGRSTVRTANLDAELSAIAASINALRSNQSLNQRDDGNIRDGRVKLFALAAEVIAFFASYGSNPRGTWQTATLYNYKDLVNQGGNTYIAVLPHLSGTFATDLAAGKWLLFSLSASPSASQVTFTSTTNIAASNVQAALEELDADLRVLISAAVSDLANTSDAAKGDALLAVVLAAAGAASRTQHQKNADFVSLRDFAGANPDGSTSNVTPVTSAEAFANEIYLPDGSYFLPGDTVLSKRYWGPGSLSYTGRSAITFTGGTLNDMSITGTYIGVRNITVFVETTTTGTPNGYRFSVDGGVTWETTTTEILPGDTEVTTPLLMSTTPATLGHTGVSIAWASTTGHTAGSRWTVTLRPNPKFFNAGNALVMRGQIAAWIDGDRSVAFGQNVMGKGRNISFENVGVGVDVLEDNQTGYGNVAVGVRAGQKNINGFLNTYMGVWAGRDNTTGDGNTAIGAYSQVIGSTGGFNTSVGNDALSFPNSGSENTAVGVQALHGNDEVQTGWNPTRNTAVGVQAMRDVENAANCAVLGFGVAPVAKSVTALSALGYNAYANLTTGNNNTGLGAQAGSSITTGGTNLFLGYFSGQNALQGVAVNNCFAIGANTYTTTSNTGVIGNSATTDVFMWGNIKPQTDNLQDIGSALARMRTVYAGTGTINTSDERLKDFGAITEAERRVAVKCKALIRKYRFHDAIELKGDGARWHFGVGAQSVAEAFESEGLDAANYGLFCYDEWPDQWAETESGRVQIQWAGNRFAIRYDELSMFILAAI